MIIQYPKRIFIRLSARDKFQIEALSRKAEILPSTLSGLALQQLLWANDTNPTATRKIHSSAATCDRTSSNQKENW